MDDPATDPSPSPLTGLPGNGRGGCYIAASLLWHRRASYGCPQSLACVELPIPTVQTALDDLAIGDLVTVTG